MILHDLNLDHITSGISREIDKVIAIFEAILEDLDSQLEKSPEGILLIKSDPKSDYTSFYERSDSQDKNGKYISKSDMSHIVNLADKRECELLRPLILKQLKRLYHIQSRYCSFDSAAFIKSLNPKLRSLISPRLLTDAEYTELWLSKEQVVRAFNESDSEYYTKKDVRMRSKSEADIGSALEDAGIPYIPEAPFHLTKWVNIKGRYFNGVEHPDFKLLHLPDRRTAYGEHFGGCDIPEYGDTMTAKIISYQMSGLVMGKTLFCTYETRNVPLNFRTIDTFIRNFIDS